MRKGLSQGPLDVPTTWNRDPKLPSNNGLGEIPCWPHECRRRPCARTYKEEGGMPTSPALVGLFLFPCGRKAAARASKRICSSTSIRFFTAAASRGSQGHVNGGPPAVEGRLSQGFHDDHGRKWRWRKRRSDLQQLDAVTVQNFLDYCAKLRVKRPSRFAPPS